jgi:hypothetical protein
VALGKAVSGWRRGSPLDESALLNRLTEVFSTQGRTDYGLKVPVEIQKQIYTLHRQGPRQTDLYGADLAVTIDFPYMGLTKTALLQLKASSALSVQVERRQLEDARAFSAGWPNSFVMAVDRERGGVRITEAAPLLRDCGEDATHSFDAASWYSATEWLHKWMCCDVGTPSTPEKQGSLEGALARFAPLRNRLPWRFERSEEPADTDRPPARAWLYLRFVPTEGGRRSF